MLTLKLLLRYWGQSSQKNRYPQGNSAGKSGIRWRRFRRMLAKGAALVRESGGRDARSGSLALTVFAGTRPDLAGVEGHAPAGVAGLAIPLNTKPSALSRVAWRHGPRAQQDRMRRRMTTISPRGTGGSSRGGPAAQSRSQALDFRAQQVAHEHCGIRAAAAGSRWPDRDAGVPPPVPHFW